MLKSFVTLWFSEKNLNSRVPGGNINAMATLINVQSLITVLGGGDIILQKVPALGFSHSLGPRDSKKSKFSHLEIYLVVLEQLTGLQ